MNPKIVVVGLASAVLAAGLTYWALSPGREVKMAKLTPAVAPTGPPLVISTAGPELPAPPVVAVKPQAASRPSPTGEPLVAVVPVPAASAKVEEPVTVSKPVEQPIVLSPEPAPPVTNAPPPPPARVPLSPPKEIDRAGVQPVVLREREPRLPNTVSINEGTLVTVRLGETLSVQKNLTGDTFFATLDAPLVADGFVIAEKGARVIFLADTCSGGGLAREVDPRGEPLVYRAISYRPVGDSLKTVATRQCPSNKARAPAAKKRLANQESCPPRIARGPISSV